MADVSFTAAGLWKGYRYIITEIQRKGQVKMKKDMSILEIKRELDMKPYLMEFMKAVIELNDEERKQLLTIMQKGE